MSAKEFEVKQQLLDDPVQIKYEEPLLTYSLFANSQCTDDMGIHETSEPNLLRDLFDYVGLGKEKLAQSILQVHPELLLQKSKLTDITNTKYQNITVFEYAVSEDVQDANMAKMMVRCIENSPYQNELADHLARQYDNCFSRKWPQSVRTVISKLEALEEAYDRLEPEDIEKAWITQIGVAQRQLKAIMRNHYCHPDLSFIREHGFYEEDLPRFLYFYRPKTNETRLWDRTASDVGEFFAITRWTYDITDKRPAARAITGKNLHKVAIRTDREALQAICVANSKELQELRSKIETLRYAHPEQETSIRL